MMANRSRATLIAEIGSVTTRVTLVDLVDGDVRLIGQAEVPSTIEPPYEDATIAIRGAAEQIGEVAGRQMLQDGYLLVPQTIEGDGVDVVLAVTSAAGQMALVIAAVASDVSARSALHASRSTYTSVLQVVTLDETAGATGPAQEFSWIERQVQRLLGLRPDVVVLAGGLEGGASDSLVRLAHIIGLTALVSRVDADGQAVQDVTVRPVIFAGNSHSRERVVESLSGRAEPIVVDNVRPTLEAEQPEPLRHALARLYNERVLPKLPGMGELQRLSAAPVRTASEAASLMTRFLSAHYQRNTLAVDVGSANTTALLHSQGRFSPAILGGVGTGYGAGSVLAERGPAAIMRWLPFPISEQELIHRLLNKMLRPHSPPRTREDLLLEHAIAREALGMAAAALLDERAGATYDMVVAGGGVLSHAPHPAHAVLTILDALQPGAGESLLAIDIHVDTLGLMAVCGALAYADPDGALTLFERDMLRNTPLATCVVALGAGRAGETAVEAELNVVGGEPQRIRVPHGQLGRIELPPGRKAQLTLKPSGGVRIGRNAAGAEVSTDVAAISGSALGVIIDARGRPLRLPNAPIERQQMLWDWLVALGAESGPLPYDAAEPLPEMSAPAIAGVEFVPEEPPAAPEPAPAPVDAGAGPSVDTDLAKLRRSVEAPKKRGLFGRK